MTETVASAPPLVELDAAPPSAELARLVGAVRAGRTVSAGGLWGASQALALAALTRHAQGPWLVVVSNDDEAGVFVDDLAAFGVDAAWLPARDAGGKSRGAAHDADRVRQRLSVAQTWAGPPERRPRVTVASLPALLEPLPDARDIEREFLFLTLGQRFDADELLAHLVESGYERTPLAEQPGEVSLRGDILDVFPYAAELPIRIEILDAEIESLRTFDPSDQRSVERLTELRICLARDSGGVEDGDGVLPTSLVAPTTVFVRVEPLRIEDRADGLSIRSGSHARALLELRAAFAKHPRLDLQSLPGDTVTLDVRSVQALQVGLRDAPAALRELAAAGTRVVVLCPGETEERRFRALLAETSGDAGEIPDADGGPGRIETRLGTVSRGFRMSGLDLVVVNHRELAGVIGRCAPKKPRNAHRAKVIQHFFELKLGDHVVHAVHGLARYEGLSRMQRGSGEEEHLRLVFADDVVLFVPACRIDLVQRYIGTGSASPPLDKLGGSAFKKRKERVERALMDLAAELLDVQARRATRKRPSWRVDAELARDLLETFPYTDTPDQERTYADLVDDLSGETPMDRLICGDVGFGKTELAIRAAFRVVAGGGQVAVLVPTTVLAQQHWETFRERLAAFPVEVAILNRYVSSKDARAVVEACAKGEVDVLVGTHRILSKDVRFAKLGLVIVDEEQRFGVTHKEHFKKLRADVDVLTLTATPIPRTLHMSLSGVRDISALTTPPEGRQEIETTLCYADDTELLREAILREKSRGGQVFFLHNRVSSIHAVANALMQLVPECTYALGHGQMGAHELKGVMNSVTSGDVDVLVATTIIESGIDIPAAGTIIVDQADMYGLSELHQLRGRVGRGSVKAYCYLVVERTKPLKQVARDRLKALEEMNQLGAGFAISMKDLEIRGAGNILGPEQSGHIGAIGYDMYCRLLKQTVERMQSGETLDPGEVARSEERGADLELGIRAFLPPEWIPATDTRLELVRELAEIRDEGDVERATEMLRDRFGRVPPEAQNLLRTFRLKAQLEEHGVTRLALRDDGYLVEFTDRVALERWIGPTGAELRAVRTGLAYLPLPRRRGRLPDAEEALEWLEGLLKAPEEGHRMPRGSDGRARRGR